MRIIIKLSFLIFVLIASADLYPDKAWSHLRWKKDGGARNPDVFITKWIIDGKPVRYCVFIEEGAKITEESASTQVRSGIKNWLKSISFYDKNNKVYRSDSTVINTDKVSIEELNCRLVPTSSNTYYTTQGKNKDGKVVPKLEYISVFFSSNKGVSFYQQGYYNNNEKFKEVNIARSRSKYYEYYANLYGVDVPTLQKIIKSKVELDRYSKLFNTTPPKIMMIDDRIFFEKGQPYIWVYMGSEKDLLNYVKEENKHNFETIITDSIYIKIENMLQSDQNYIYPFDEFCKDEGVNCSEFSYSSFDLLLHEFGHAFGLGDEYEGGLKSSNDRNYMSASINPSAMKGDGIFFPTKDDVVGLTYLFDRLIGRNIEQRTFKFEDYPESKYAINSKDVIAKIDAYRDYCNSSGNMRRKGTNGTQLLVSGTRANPIKDILIPEEAISLYIIEITYDDLEKRILPKLIEHDKNLGKRKPKHQGDPPPSLEEITIAWSDLTAVPPDITKFKGLLSLDLSNNKLTSLPPEIATMDNLTHLALGINNFTSLPIEVTMLKNLSSLNLTGNPITSLPLEMADMKKLKHILIDLKNLDQHSNELLKYLSDVKGVDIN